MLPEYLNYETCAAAKEQQIVDSGNCRFTVLTSRLIRMEYGTFTDRATLSVIRRDFDTPEFEVTRKDGILTIKTKHLLLNYAEGGEFSEENLKITLLDKPYTCWHYGEKPLQNLGGTVTTLDMKNGECQIGDGLCSIDGFALLDDSKTPLFDEKGWFEKRDATTDIYFFGYGRDYTQCIKDYYRLTGAPEMLPAFALGNWWSRYYKYTEDSYLELMDRFKANDVPISVGIVDMDWHLTDGDGRDYRTDGWTGYTWNKKYFPDHKRFIGKLHDRNLKTALNLHPQSGIRHWEEQYERVAKQLGIDPDTKEPIPFNFVDTEIWRTYFEELLFPYEKDGVDFWWMDWQEQFDYYKPIGDKLECMSPLWMLNHFHYLASKRKGERGMIFSRFAGFGSQRYPIGFSGDTIITWDSLKFQPYFTVTASNVGYSFWSHDIGGHMGGYRDDELNTRWIQFGVFSPIFRLHSSDNIFTGREPWGYNKRAELIINDLMRLRHKMFPYLYTMCYRNYKELIPLMRPLYHTNPDEASAYEFKNEYWFGSEMIVAPITEKADDVTGLGKTKVWLPKGRWVDLFTGDIYLGDNKYTVSRPLEQIPVFCKAGAIIPMQKHTEKDNSLGNAEKLEITICAGDNGRFVLYEDDGKTMSYQNGDNCTTEFILNWNNDRAVFTKKASQNNLSLIPEKREYTLIFKGFAKGCEFFDGENKISAVYNENDNSYTLETTEWDSDKEFSIKVKATDKLLNDNSGAAERIVDILSRCQCSFINKNHWYDILKEVISDPNTDNITKYLTEIDGCIAEVLTEQLLLLTNGTNEKIWSLT